MFHNNVKMYICSVFDIKISRFIWFYIIRTYHCQFVTLGAVNLFEKDIYRYQILDLASPDKLSIILFLHRFFILRFQSSLLQVFELFFIQSLLYFIYLFLIFKFFYLFIKPTLQKCIKLIPCIKFQILRALFIYLYIIYLSHTHRPLFIYYNKQQK